jgi:serine phosphatase RsbU (regulator of sigma subunit)
MGTLYEELNQNEKALKSYEKALEVKLSLEGINPETIGSTYNKIGKQYMLIGQYSGAIENLEKGIEYSKKSGSLKYLAEAYKNLAEAYSQSGNNGAAYQYLKYYSETNDSLSELLYNDNLSELKVQYETEQKDKDIALLNNSVALNEQTLKLQELEVEEGKRKNQLITVMLVGALMVIVLVLGLGLVLYRSNVNRKKTNELLAKTNDEISLQKHIIEEKHKEITDSINYAERIQRSFLASKDLLDNNLKDYFVIFKPKDVVSGDFYWAGVLNDGCFGVCCADSTGHGVPGAIMSILNISSIEKAIEMESSPSKILDKTREIIIERLKKDGSVHGGKDGMDCTFISLSSDKSKLSFSGANNSMFIVRDNSLLEYPRDRMPVGKHENDATAFSEVTCELLKGDMIYTLTDGLPDQFGGEKSKKFMMKNVKNLFLEVATLTVSEQHERIQAAFDNWKGDNEQIDDVCIMGIRI